MTDLPRFTAGSLGPIGFNQVNEMMRRLDALRPFIESVELSQERTSGLKERVMVVYAKKMESEQDKYRWREVAIRDDGTVASFIDEDWEPIVLDVVTRGGGDSTTERPGAGDEPTPETYAVSITNFDEGFAICFVRRTVGGERRYLLVPLSSASNLFMITSDSGEVEIPVLPSLNVTHSAYSYSAVRMTIAKRSESSLPGEIGLMKSTLEIPFYDFGLAEPNLVEAPENVTLEEVPLKVGSFFLGHTVIIGTQEVGYLAQVPRLKVEC